MPYLSKALIAIFIFLGLTVFFFFSVKSVNAQECVPSYTECCRDYYSKMVYEWDDGSGYCGEGGCDIRDGACDPPPPPPPSQICTPNERCLFDDYGPDFCCNSNPPSKTTSNPKGNNVCNYEYWWYCNGAGTACDQGPYAYTLNSVTHACTRVLACGICRANETQTETQYLTSCNSSINGGSCPGIENYCSETVTQQQRTRTCNADCGGWSGWSGWSTVNQYPQCSTSCSTISDPSSSCYSHTHRYRCDVSLCIHDDAGGTTTDPNCGGACSAPPARYRCSSGSCIRDDASGTTTDPNCGGACVAPPPPPPPGSCSVSWSLSNSNPPPNSTIQARVTGISDPNGWPNVALYRDGGTADYCWGGITNPWPTFIYNCVPSGTSGTHNLAFTVQPSGRSRYSCTPTQNFTTQNITPSNLQVSGVPACASGPFNVTLSWTNTNSTLWADISTNGFASYSNKNVSNQTSTAAPAGFNPGLTLNPNTTYQWRLWNGSVHTVGPSFIAPFCVPSPPTLNAPSCPAPGTTASISWNASSGATYYMLRADDQTANGWNGQCNGNQNPGDVCEDIAATSKNFASIANHTYSWWVHACNSSGCSAPTSGTNFTCTPPPPPPCTNTSPGTNQLTGCLWDGVNFNTPDGNAPDGVSLPSPVPDTIYALNQDWGTGQPNSFVGADTFSARWRGNFTFKAGTYTFYAGADDGVRVRIDGVTVLDDWRDTSYFERSFSRSFPTAGIHLVEIDYYENGGQARATLRWTYTPPPPPLSPWIQVIDGDVHSDTAINAPGGP